MRFLTALTLLLLPSLALSQTVTAPDKVTVETPGLVVIRATSFDADDLHWYAVGPGLQTFPPDVVPPKLGVFLGFAMREGTYKLGVIPAKDVNGKAKIGMPVYVTVVVGGGGPPTPPDPPKPPVPPPTDPLAAALSAAYAKETDPNKADHAATLATLFRQGITLSADSAIKTNKQWLDKLHGAAEILMPGGLPVLRRAVADYLNTVLPRDPNGAIDRNLFSITARNVAAVLEGLK